MKLPQQPGNIKTLSDFWLKKGNQNQNSDLSRK